jgi:hypothetical protein
MALTLRIVLVACSLFTSVYAIRRIRSARVDIGDTVYWILFSFYLLLISIFPGIMSFFSRILGIQSPVNMVFLSVIALLGYKCFTLSIKVSAMEIKLKTLALDLSLEKAKKE